MPSKKQNVTKLEALPADQIAKLKDSFEIIDHDNDGIISDEDLKNMSKTTGKELSEKEIEVLLSRSKGPMNFSTFLSLLSGDLNQLPNKSEIQRALQVFSADTEVDAKELCENLRAVGMEESEFKPILERFKTERMNGDQVFMGTNFLNFVSN